MLIIIIFKIIGAAEAAANLLCEFKIAEKKIYNKKNKRKVILLTELQKFFWIRLKPGAINDTKA